jgi:hypothetical protein
MRRVSRVPILVAVLIVLFAAAASAAPDTWARGAITAMGPDSITLDVKGQAMTFKVTSETDVIARGAGTKAREVAKATGEKPKFSDLLKVGDQVEVRYSESGGTMTADMIRAGISTGAMTSADAAKGAMKKAEGVVTAMAADSLSLKGADGTAMTFMVDDTLRVVGEGLGTMEKQKAAKGGKVTLAEAVAVGDTVQVMYKEVGEMKHASSVIVRKKGT